MKKKFYGMLAAVLIASCICVPQVKVQAEDVYDDSDWSDSWYDNDVTPIPDLTNVTIDKTSQTGYTQKADNYYYGTQMPTYRFTLQNTPCTLNDYDDGVLFSTESSNSSIDVYASLENNVISLTPDAAGKTTVTITINSKTFQVTINTIAVELPNSLLLSTKQKTQIKAKGVSTIKWKSTNPSVATISGNGTVCAKKDRKYHSCGNHRGCTDGMCGFRCQPVQKTCRAEGTTDCKDLYIQPAKAYAGKILRLQFPGMEILS